MRNGILSVLCLSVLCIACKDKGEFHIVDTVIIRAPKSWRFDSEQNEWSESFLLAQDKKNNITVIINKLPTEESVALKQLKYAFENVDDPFMQGAYWGDVRKTALAKWPMLSIDFSNSVDGCDVGGCLSVVNAFYRTILIVQTYEMKNKQDVSKLASSINFIAPSDTTAEALDARLNFLIKLKTQQTLSENDAETGMVFTDAEKTGGEIVYTYKRTTEYRPTTREINQYLSNAKDERISRVVNEASVLMREWLRRGKELRYVFLDVNDKEWGDFVVTEDDVLYEEARRKLDD